MSARAGRRHRTASTSRPSTRIVGEPGNRSACASSSVRTSRSSTLASTPCSASTDCRSSSASGCEGHPSQYRNSIFIPRVLQRFAAARASLGVRRRFDDDLDDVRETDIGHPRLQSPTPRSREADGAHVRRLLGAGERALIHRDHTQWRCRCIEALTRDRGSTLGRRSRPEQLVEDRAVRFDRSCGTARRRRRVSPAQRRPFPYQEMPRGWPGGLFALGSVTGHDCVVSRRRSARGR